MMGAAVGLVLLWCSAVSSQPRPELGPGEVVGLVLSALRHVNSPAPNAGIYTTYRFASPSNHAATGPYGHFIGLVKNADFAPLLSANTATLGEIEINHDHAAQTVTIHVDAGRTAIFKFTLSKQRDGVWRGCWMVDGVQEITH